IEGVEPDTGDANTGQFVEAAHEARKVAHSVTVAILVRFDVQTINDGVFVPQVSASHAVSYAGVLPNCGPPVYGRAGLLWRASGQTRSDANGIQGRLQLKL